MVKVVIYPLVMSNIAIENGHLVRGWFSIVMLNYQRVNDLFRHFPGSDRCVQRSSSMLLWQIDHENIHHANSHGPTVSVSHGFRLGNYVAKWMEQSDFPDVWFSLEAQFEPIFKTLRNPIQTYLTYQPHHTMNPSPRSPIIRVSGHALLRRWSLQHSGATVMAT